MLAPFLFTLYRSDFRQNTSNHHLQMLSNDPAIVGRVSEGNNQEYQEVIANFVNCCELNRLYINASKTKETVVDFCRKDHHTTPVNIQGLDIGMVGTYKYLGVHLNNKRNWSNNTDVLFKKSQSANAGPSIQRLSDFTTQQ